LTFDDLVELCPPLQPRYYSISSSSIVHPKRVAVTVGLLSGQTVRSTPFNGIASTYLHQRRIDDRVRLALTESDFHLPSDPSTPIVLIGAGTGIAPFIGFIEERAFLRQQGIKCGPIYLYFGCDRPDHDFLYSNLFELQNKEDFHLRAAFSKASDLNHPTQFIQDLVFEDNKLIWRLIDSCNASIYVCGHNRLGQGVDQSLQAVVSMNHHVPIDKAESFLEDLKHQRRYVRDIFE
jgi:cytochrome P450/NADPH-cytochrome P450 reductase